MKEVWREGRERYGGQGFELCQLDPPERRQQGRDRTLVVKETLEYMSDGMYICLY